MVSFIVVANYVLFFNVCSRAEMEWAAATNSAPDQVWKNVAHICLLFVNSVRIKYFFGRVDQRSKDYICHDGAIQFYSINAVCGKVCNYGLCLQYQSYVLWPTVGIITHVHRKILHLYM